MAYFDSIAKVARTPERVEMAAVRVGLDVYTVPRPLRHGDAIRVAAYCEPDYVVQPDDQGFVTNKGRFVGRLDAKNLAVAAGQILDREAGKPELFSEDIW